ncbi:uncharacterized protein C5L36_0A03230 [Pichia kudriavzevii]|uniref:Protein-serine/threonine kinase n=1 Tax=Pichia kudriavzevii TaxID=4909 RepID=A0A2U9QXG6_PICKU|nr:uncharacterized protein C5L36_0A03230 [Pichia kudriavzevii]AWU73721.1 hypothetical protein C5L36_0A03230 [Pichia kudriavzevii]
MQRLQTHKLIQRLATNALPSTRKTLLTTSIYPSANQTLETLLILISKRLESMSKLPYIGMMNVNMAKIWTSYISSCQDLLNYTNAGDYQDLMHFQIGNDLQNKQFVSILEKLLIDHADNIPFLRDGLTESEIFKNDESKEREFLNLHLKERILMRLIASDHIEKSNGNLTGVADRNLDVLDVLHKSIDFVDSMTLMKYYEKVKIDIETRIVDNNGDDKLVFPYISTHIEYVLNEILKNSARATIENNSSEPIKILVILNKLEKTLQFRVSDSGGGVPPHILPHLWDYAFTTVNETSKSDTLGLDTGVHDNIVAGMGYGLPLSLIYTKIFGGDLNLRSVWGKGTDAYILFKGI